VAKKHDDTSKEHGPYIANGSMRTLRAIYNHARKTNKSLPADNPANAIDWNREMRRDTGMGIDDLKMWFTELAALENPVRREFHLFTLLSGCRSSALQEVRPHHVNFRERQAGEKATASIGNSRRRHEGTVGGKCWACSRGHRGRENRAEGNKGTR